MAESKGPQDSAPGKGPATSGAAGHPRRSGLARWRPYSAAIVAVGVIFALSALIGTQVRVGESATATPPAGVPSEDPLAIGVNPAVPVTLTVYEDLRNPASRIFAQQYQSTINAILDSGQARVEYRFVTSADKQYGGDGSAMAANAAACAQNQGKDLFVAFMDELWSHQPERRHDRFASEGYLEKLAAKVRKLDAAQFAPCVHNKDFMGWVKASQKAFTDARLGEVPVLQIDGRTISPAQDQLTPAKLEQLVAAAVTEAETAASAPSPGASPSASPSSKASPANSASAPASRSASPSATPSGSPS